MDEHDLRVEQSPRPHCTLCALGIPGHVGGNGLPHPGQASLNDSSDPVAAYLEHRRLGLRR